MSLIIAGLARGHNAGVCLLIDGEIIFSVEEERLTRCKYDGGPLASLLKIKEYVDKVDYLVISHTQSLNETAGKNMPDTFFDRVVQKLGGTPTEEKRKFFRAWKAAEDTDAKNNPLATTLKLKTSHGGSTDMEGSYNNGQPVQDYKTEDAGVDATYWTLKNTYGGKA